MKKALIIIVVVAGYCACEVVALLCILFPGSDWLSPSPRQIVILAAQLLLIPGSAALFSRLVYGAASWRKRALIILALGAGSPVALIGVLLVLDVIVERVSTRVVPFIMLAVLSGICFPLFLGIRKMRKWGVQLETARWLTERQSGVSLGERRWKFRGIGWSLWIPSLTVLLIFLFLPESWGVASHLFQPRAGRLGNYRVPIPITWVVLDTEDRSEYSRVSGLASQSPTLGIKQYLQGNWLLSTWDVQTTELRSSANDQVISQRAVNVAGTSGTCFEYRPYYLAERKVAQAPSVAMVRCAIPGGLSASFYSDRVQLPAFYRMLEGIKRQK